MDDESRNRWACELMVWFQSEDISYRDSIDVMTFLLAVFKALDNIEAKVGKAAFEAMADEALSD